MFGCSDEAGPGPVKSKYDALDFDTLLKEAQRSLHRWYALLTAQRSSLLSHLTTSVQTPPHVYIFEHLKSGRRKKIGPSYWGRSAAGAWGRNREMKQQQKEVRGRGTLAASERPWLSVANPCSLSVWSSWRLYVCRFFRLVFCNLLSLSRWTCNSHRFCRTSI